MQTFKVGDWIKEPSGKLHKLTCIPEPDSYFADECTIWQPQPGEWCWFWNDDNTLVLAQFAHGLLNGAKFTSKNLMYRHCEPFIGQLPTILQPQPKGNYESKS